MLINISQFLLQPDRLLLAILLRNRRRKLAQLTENKWLLHNCNFKRKPVTKPPHRSLSNIVSQATPHAAVMPELRNATKRCNQKCTVEKT